MAGIPDVSVLYYRSDGRDRTTRRARPLGEGLYEATVEANISATYYVYVAAPSRSLDYSDESMLSLMAIPATARQKQEAVN